MSDISDDDIFGGFDNRMDTEPIQIDSDDSFDAGAPTSSHTMDRKSIIEKYQKLKEESKKLDDLAVEVGFQHSFILRRCEKIHFWYLPWSRQFYFQCEKACAFKEHCNFKLLFLQQRQFESTVTCKGATPF